MAPNFLDLATTLQNLGARWLLEKKVNFVPCYFVSLHACNYTHFGVLVCKMCGHSVDTVWLLHGHCV